MLWTISSPCFRWRSALLLPAIIQLSVGNGLEPVMFGNALNLTSISILASLVVFGAMWGV